MSTTTSTTTASTDRPAALERRTSSRLSGNGGLAPDAGSKGTGTPKPDIIVNWTPPGAATPTVVVATWSVTLVTTTSLYRLAATQLSGSFVIKKKDEKSNLDKASSTVVAAGTYEVQPADAKPLSKTTSGGEKQEELRGAGGARDADFAKGIRSIYNKCVVTGAIAYHDAFDMLEAAHIFPHSGKDNDAFNVLQGSAKRAAESLKPNAPAVESAPQINDPNDRRNGVLLRADVHSAFDAWTISVDTGTTANVYDKAWTIIALHPSTAYLAGKPFEYQKDPNQVSGGLKLVDLLFIKMALDAHLTKAVERAVVKHVGPEAAEPEFKKPRTK